MNTFTQCHKLFHCVLGQVILNSLIFDRFIPVYFALSCRVFGFKGHSFVISVLSKQTFHLIYNAYESFSLRLTENPGLNTIPVYNH